MSQLHKRFGAALRERRRAHGLSQSQLAANAKLSLKYVGEVERGEANASMDALDRLARALSWDPFAQPTPSALSFTPTAAVRRVLIVQLTSMRELANQQADVQEALAWIDRLVAGVAHGPHSALLSVSPAASRQSNSHLEDRIGERR